MKRQRSFGAYVQLNIETDSPRLPSNLLDKLKEAINSGVIQSSKFVRKRTELEEKDFFEVMQHFKKEAQNNQPFFHLLVSCFLKSIRKHMALKGEERIFGRNFYIVCGMIQRELTLMCLTMHEEDLESSREWMKYVEGIEEEGNKWEQDYRGALSVARLARLFAERGIKVYLPTVYIDIQWRIDLIARVPKKPFGLCVQVKTFQTSESLTYRMFENTNIRTNEEDLRDKDCLFVNGVAFFNDHSLGSWIPIEIKVGDAAYPIDTVIPPSTMFPELDDMLKSIYTPKTVTSTSVEY